MLPLHPPATARRHRLHRHDLRPPRVNIAPMKVGRQPPGGEAIGVLNLDTVPNEEAMREVSHFEHIASVSVALKLPAEGESCQRG